VRSWAEHDSAARTRQARPFTTFIREALGLNPAGCGVFPEPPHERPLHPLRRVTAALDRFDASARRTAAAPLDNLAEETVERIGAKIAVAANAAVIRTADDMTGALLDILA
jgi:hypothetical protein